MIRPGTDIISRLRKSRGYLLLAPALVVVFLSLPGIGQGDFRTDSHVYVAVVLEMMRSGDWIHPMQGNVPYHNKPPLGFWMVAPLIAAFGPTLIAVRVAMILIAALCASAVTGMCRDLVSSRVALTAGLVFALTHEVFRYTHAFSLDLPLMLFMVLSAWSIVHAAGIRQGKARSGWWIVLGGAPMGLALMVKPMLGLLILLPMVVWLVLVHRGKLLPWVGGLVVVALMIAAPWHLEMMRAYPAESVTPFIDNYLLAQSVDRLSAGSTHVTEPVWYYPVELVQSYLPWVVFLVGGLVWMGVKRRSITGRWQGDLLTILWAGVWIGVMSLSAGKSMRYIVPVYPALALLVAGVLVHMPPRGRFTPILLPWIIGLIGLVGFFSNIEFHSPAPSSRADLFAFLDSYSDGTTEDWPTIWIAPDQVRTAAHFSIERGIHPFVAMSSETPTGGEPSVGELMLYRTPSHYAVREGDTVLGEFGVWVVTRLERNWDGVYSVAGTE